jgi:hypothetical protein
VRDFWKAIFTGVLCLIVVGSLSAVAFYLRRELPWLSAATVVADAGIIFGFYKLILDTTKTANDLRKSSLEIESLRLEIDKKKKEAERTGRI